jgi:hypothetical protein
MRACPTQSFTLRRQPPAFRDLVLQPWSQNFDPTSPLSRPVGAVKIATRWVGSCAAGTTAPRNRDRERATQPSKIPPRISRNHLPARVFGRSKSADCRLATPKAKTKSFNTEHTEKRGEIQSILCSVISVDFLCALCVESFFWMADYFKYVRTISIKSSAASSEDFVFRGMWWRMWSSINSPMRLLMAPRAAERRCRTSAHGSS